MLSERSGQENTGAFLNQSLGDRTGKKRDRTGKKRRLVRPIYPKLRRFYQ